MKHRYMRAHAPAEVRQRPPRAPDIAPHAAGPCATCSRCNPHASGPGVHGAQKLRAQGRWIRHRCMRAHAPADVRQRPPRALNIAPHAAGPCATCNRCNLHASGWHAKAYGLRKRALTNAPDSRVQRKGSDEGPPKRRILTRAQQVRADRLDRMPPRRTPRSGLSTAKNAIAPKTDTSETRNDWGICTHWRATLCSACADAPPPVLPTSRTSSPFRSAPR